MTLNFIDTSDNNLGVPDATIGGDGIWFKLAEGGVQVDPDFQASYNEARAAGKLLGAYDFARPDLNGPIDEASAWVANLQRHGVENDDTVYILDWEHTPSNDPNWCKQFADQVYAVTGVRIMIYMNLSTANAYDWSILSQDYALIVARYWDMSPDYNFDMTNAGPPPVVTDSLWPYGYAMWQWTSTGRIDGYNGNLDCSIFYGDADQWKAYARSRPVTTTTTTIEPTTTTTTEAPAPVDPSTTTTTTAPQTATTTTTTEVVDPTPPVTTTTTTVDIDQPTQGSSWWALIVAAVLSILKRIRS